MVACNLPGGTLDEFMCEVWDGFMTSRNNVLSYDKDDTFADVVSTKGVRVRDIPTRPTYTDGDHSVFL